MSLLTFIKNLFQGGKQKKRHPVYKRVHSNVQNDEKHVCFIAPFIEAAEEEKSQND